MGERRERVLRIKEEKRGEGEWKGERRYELEQRMGCR